MNAELERACAEWAAAGQHGTVEERVARSKRWLCYYDMMAKRQDDAWDEEGMPSRIAEYLARKGYISDKLPVLDIGAGAEAIRCPWPGAAHGCGRWICRPNPCW